ncbi:haloacid dehalogenase-like hydrolase [Cognatilysobacter terrigena]|uniref:haloacid dehalogenase-like hydrolase n=1 Tax=Cognatilysobacter terrigena TaxID=2488749 RepID=UPI00105F9D2A|nr:haloacid dehalogenase-like hydrolase [Lysobacter terrigena]
MTLDAPRYPSPASDAPLIVFDFDHTLYDGDSGSHLFAWLIRRSAWRMLLALLIASIAGPMIAFLPTRRHGIGAFAWAGTVFERESFDALIDRYVAENVDGIRARLLPVALDVFHRHRLAGDNVVVATGAPPRLARAILAFAAHEDVPVIGTEVERVFGGIRAARHCHHAMKMTMLRDAGFRGDIAAAYSDSTADLPLLQAARRPVVVNPKEKGVAFFRERLPPGTPMLNWGCPGRAGDAVSADA